MCIILSFFGFSVLLGSARRTKPFLVIRRSRGESNTSPKSNTNINSEYTLNDLHMKPYITIITANHRGTIIRTSTCRTNINFWSSVTNISLLMDTGNNNG